MNMDLKDFVSMVIVSILSNICYMVVVPFVPLEFSRYDIKPSTFGYIFAIFSVAAMIGSLVIGKLMIIFGRKVILLLGICSMGVCMSVFSSIAYFENSTLVVLMLLASRFLQGFASSMIQTTCYAIISVCYDEDKQKYLGYFEGAQGLGCMIGPAIGAILYSFYGFNGTFYFLGGSLVLMCPLLYFQIPNTINKNDDLEEDMINDEVILDNNQVIQDVPTYTSLLKRKVFLLSALCGGLSYASVCYFEPILPIRLKDVGLSQTAILYFFCIAPFSYLLLSLTIPYLTSKFTPKMIITTTIFLCGIGQFFIGPSPFLPDNLFLMAFGQFAQGSTSIFFLILALPVMIKDAEDRYPTYKTYASDLSSGVFNFSLSLGQTLSPIYSTNLTEIIGFQNVCTTVAIAFIVYSLIYYIFCIAIVEEPKEIECEIELESQGDELLKEKSCQSSKG
ncbi:unnamed protein product [Moneuplotes crassus]|uniref:Major facilitator superfamily (MFS) profile domain-containing protein n=1 Tax=Euplotes crassus TaxID=5936 RepID=A0AAD1UNX3_EUPCR|nr:unnamed protein product [Moneuplotes crassus]